MTIKRFLSLFMTMALLSISVFAQTTGKTEDIHVTVGGASRLIKVHTPPMLQDNAPLVISMHGVNQSAEYQMNTTNWNNLSDQNGFIVVFPEGEGLWWDVSGDKDVTFIRYVVNYMAKNYKINKNRVYATGFSLGAMMTYHLLTKTAGTFAAYGPVSGVCFDNRKITASRHVPLIHHHGSADDVFKFGGDPGHMAGGYPSITEYVTKWAEWNGCDMDSPVVKKIGGDTKTIWTNKEEGIQTVFNVINGAGHWHSDSQWGGINTTDELWNFFKRYSLDNDISFAVTRTSPNASTPLNTSSTIYIALTDNVFAKAATATLEGQGQTINLVNISNVEKGKMIKFQLPTETDIVGGEYKLTIKGVQFVETYQKGELSYTYTVEPYSTGIQGTTKEVKATEVYGLSGTKVSAPQNGINIVKTSNGKVKKVLQKN